MDIMPVTFETWELFAKFGIAGILVGVLIITIMTGAFLIRSVIRESMADRNSAESRWMNSFMSVAEKADERQKETNEVLRDLGGTIKFIEGKIK